MRRGQVIALSALLALTTACSATPATQDSGDVGASTAPSSSVTAEAPVPTVTAPSPTAIPTDALDYYSGERVDQTAPQAVWDESSRTAALKAATTVLTLFARPTLSYETWWSALAPTLSDDAQRDYADTDPAQVPAHGVTGPAELTNVTSPLVAVVAVPTDIGTYTVVLSRGGASDPWLAERITPPPAAR